MTLLSLVVSVLWYLFVQCVLRDFGCKSYALDRGSEGIYIQRTQQEYGSGIGRRFWNGVFHFNFLGFLAEHDVPSILLLRQLDLLLVGSLPTVRFHHLVASLTAASLLEVCSASVYDSVPCSLSYLGFPVPTPLS